MSSRNEIKINQLFLSGKTISPDLTHLIASELGLQTEFINPFATIKWPAEFSLDQINNLAPRMLICCGLALRRKYEW